MPRFTIIPPGASGGANSGSNDSLFGKTGSDPTSTPSTARFTITPPGGTTAAPAPAQTKQNNGDNSSSGGDGGFLRTLFGGANKVLKTVQGLGAMGVGAVEKGIGAITGNKNTQNAGQDTMTGAAALNTTPTPVVPKNNVVGGALGDYLAQPTTPLGYTDKGKKETTGQAIEESAGIGVNMGTLIAGGSGSIWEAMATGAGLGAGQAMTAKDSAQDVLGATVIGTLLGAGTYGVGKGLSKIASWATTKVPLSLYNKIFKLTDEDWGDVINSKAAQDLKTTNPNLFKTLVDKGAIKTGSDGSITVNKSMAQKMLDQNLRGSLENMGKTAVASLWKSEQDVQTLVAGHTDPINVPNKQALINFFDSVKERYSAGDVPQVLNKAQGFLDTLSKGDSISAEDMLQMRRFLDGIRIARSFTDQPMTKFNVTQGTVINLSNSLRSTLSSEVEGLGPVMGKYSTWINALDDLKSAAVRNGNQASINIIDEGAFGIGEMAGGPGMGTALAVGRRALLAPSVQTGMGSALYKVGQSGAGDIISKTASGLSTPAMAGETSLFGKTNQPNQ